MAQEQKTNNLNNNLKRLSEIADWFDRREEVDVEDGLARVKEAVVLIKVSKQRLKEIENEFEEIKKDIDAEDKEIIGDSGIKDIPF